MRTKNNKLKTRFARGNVVRVSARGDNNDDLPERDIERPRKAPRPSKPAPKLGRSAIVGVRFKNEDVYVDATLKLLASEATFHIWGNHTITISDRWLSWLDEQGFPYTKVSLSKPSDWPAGNERSP